MSEVVDLDQYTSKGDSVTVYTNLGDVSFTSMAVDDLSTFERIINDDWVDKDSMKIYLSSGISLVQ